MSSIAGPSSHAYSSFPAATRQSPAISTTLRRIQDAPDYSYPATPVLTTAPTTAPPTPVVRSSSGATDAREISVDPAASVNGSVVNGMNGRGEARPVKEEPRDAKEGVAADLDAVRTRTIALGKKHGRSDDELEAMVQTAARIAARLAEDQRAALYPDVDNPFTDELDVLNRLLPYHVFQQPKEDLDVLIQYGTPLPSRKGKRKATEEDLLREEIADTKFALECWKRKRGLERRLMKARINTGKRASPDDQGYVLAQAVLEAERAETAALSAELKAARAELDKIEREKRAAAPPPSTPAPKPTPTVRTSNASSYYSPSTTSTPTTATFMPPYRPPYSYSYSQYPSTQYSYNPHAYGSYTPTTTAPYGSVPQTPATPTTTYNPTAGYATATPTSAASAQVQQAQASPASAISNAAIPVQLPVNSLPALAALGIVPVAAASVPPAGQPQPPAVIRSTNGSMLSLEINLSLLQSAQMSGLVLILNALTSRGVNVDGSTSAGTATSASTNGYNGVVASNSTASASAGPVATSSASATATAASTPSTSSGSASPASVSAS
ncbi:hypothetical protein K466DRAFT_543279 [Polyporus arcularius HHB13444]|uniref:GLTSCR protein conserved domain-containing protein n=1 Tax=Polyporus arcularius HHB13444 TaxID=1314778 RepID=A0A5C3PM33_9APHY|nr:hypothetical protein K466DRAFT_543279 [Polyporus arcularius HHB13444]